MEVRKDIYAPIKSLIVLRKDESVVSSIFASRRQARKGRAAFAALHKVRQAETKIVKA